MKCKKNSLIKLEKVSGSPAQIIELYKILSERKHNISNTSTPSYKMHKRFVKCHPYRAWYLIKIDDIFIGSAYIMNNNGIGISLVNNFSILNRVINLLFKKHKPLKEIKSIRPPYFFINIAPSNKAYKSELTKIGARKIQSTYSLSSLQVNDKSIDF